MHANKDTERAIRLVWDSLLSHLDKVAIDPLEGITDKKARAIIGDRKFHVRCVQEYAEVIYTLSKLLK